jgi:hypothetical protein
MHDSDLVLYKLGSRGKGELTIYSILEFINETVFISVGPDRG